MVQLPPRPEARPDPAFWGADRAGRRRSSRRPSWGEILRDRWERHRGDARIAVVGLVLVAAAVGFVWYRAGAAGPPEAVVRPSTPRTTTGGDGSAPRRSGPRVVVHVAGAVTRPGVVELELGARVIDALEAVGGARPEADLDRLNLAAKLVDGQRILVTRVGEVASVPSSSSSSGAGAATGGPPGEGALLDLNTATQAQLEALPGIGPALAAAILEERERRGGFRSINELRSVRGIGDRRFADLRDRVAV